MRHREPCSTKYAHIQTRKIEVLPFTQCTFYLPPSRELFSSEICADNTNYKHENYTNHSVVYKVVPIFREELVIITVERL